MIGALWKLIIFTSMVNRIINISGNERVTVQIYDTCLQMFDVCTLRHMAHIEAIVQFLPYSDLQVTCDGPHSRGNSLLQIRYVHRLWWHKHFVLAIELSPECLLNRNNWFVHHKLQHTKRFLLFSRHYPFVTSETEREEEIGIAHAQSTKLEHLLSCSMWKTY